jgi:hypothetical protein
MRGDALADALLVDGVGQEREIAVDVCVDEPGADNLSRGIDKLACGSGTDATDCHDPIAGGAHIGQNPR